MSSRTRTAWPRPDLSAMTDAWQDVADAYGAFLDVMNPVAAVVSPTRHESRHEPGRCHDCGTRCAGSCHCDCCVSDADLVVRARFGERRVVPIRIHNERQRARQIGLDLGGFTTSGGREVPVHGRIVTPTSFELDACSEHEAVVVIEAGAFDGQFEEAIEEGRRPLDVDDCTVAYADMRIQGCDVRPVRIAVQVLPRDCEAHRVHCACGCC